jgi:hypothetical protein
MIGAARPLEVPLRIAGRRFWMWGLLFGFFTAVVISNSIAAGYIDFPQFWAAGRTVGTPDLLDRARHGAWELANGVSPDLFPYTPGTAWLFAPFAAFSISVGFWLHAAVMAVLVGVAGWLGARAYGLDWRVGFVVAVAWSPCLIAAAFGQNSPIALVCILVAIEGLRRDDDRLVGLGVGLLLYKPTLAIPLLGLLLLRGRWRALGVAGIAAGVWYLVSVAATAGDWAWPVHLASALGVYYGPNTDFNVSRATSLPGVMVGHGVPTYVAWSLALLVVAAALPRLRRAPLVEAAAGACLVGLAVSPHSLNYEAAVALPFILWMLGATGTGIREPVRTWLIYGLCAAGLMLLLALWAGMSSVGIAVLVLTAIWISGWQRFESGPTFARPPRYDGAGQLSA